MKTNLMVVGTPPSINIGDYIQALAARQFYSKVDGYIERELLRSYDGEETAMIMNGYYMHNPVQWPPSAKIHPLFVSIHINSLVKNELLSEDSVKYLKLYEPIGCRDYDTVDMLKEKGIDAYFSGCLTLTLGYKYKVKIEERSDIYYFVEPSISDINIIQTSLKVLTNLSIILKKRKKICYVGKKYYQKKRLSIKELLKMIMFYIEYSKYIDAKIIEEAEYIIQQREDIHSQYPTNKDKLEYAEELLDKYAKAKLVVTSRIHCALPCLGLETPVLFTEHLQQPEYSYCRLNGLREFFNIAVWDSKQGKLSLQFELDGKINENNIPDNKSLYKKYAEALFSKCKSFIITQE